MSTENVVELNAVQQEIRDTIKTWDNSGNLIVVALGALLNRFYGEDNQSCDNIAFFLNELHGRNRKPTIRNILRILPLYVFLDVTFSKAGDNYNVVNTKGIPKPKKAKGQEALEAMDWTGFNTLSNHPSLIAVKPKGKKKSKKPVEELTFRDAVLAELDKGVTLDEMVAMLAEIVKETEVQAA